MPKEWWEDDHAEEHDSDQSTAQSSSHDHADDVYDQHGDD